MRSSTAFACGFSIVVGVGLILKSSSSGKKSFLNSLPLSYITLRGRGYLDNQTLLNMLLAVALLGLDCGSSHISNQPVAKSTKVIALSSNFSPVLVLTLSILHSLRIMDPKGSGLLTSLAIFHISFFLFYIFDKFCISSRIVRYVFPSLAST